MKRDWLQFAEKIVALLPQVIVIELHDRVPRVCYHFDPIDDVDNDNWGQDALYVQAARDLFEQLSFNLDVEYVGGHVGIEAWEEVLPTAELVYARIETLTEVGQQAGLRLYGWSFEPVGGPFVSAGLDVLVGGSPEADAQIEEMTSVTKNPRSSSDIN